MRLVIFILFLIVFHSSKLKAQQLLQQWPVEDEITGLQAVVKGDSILLVYLERNAQTLAFNRKALWVNEQTASAINLDLLGEYFLSAVDGKDNVDYYYFFEGTNSKRALKGFTNSSEQTFTVLSSDQIKGDLLGILFDQNLFAFSFEKKSNVLHVYEVEGDTLKQEQTFQMPYDLSYYYIGSFSFVEQMHPLSVAQGSAEFKFYKHGEKIQMTIDQSRYGKTSRTEIISFSLDSKAEPMVRYVPGPKKKIFRSFLRNDTLYRASITRKSAEVSAFNVSTGKNLSAYSIKAGDKEAALSIITRAGHLSQIHQRDNLDNMMQTSGNFFPSIYVRDDGEVILGNYIYSESPTLETSGLGLGRMIGYHQPSLYRLTSEIHGISKSFHLRFSKGNFSPEGLASTKTVRDKIDEYELAHPMSNNGMKGYINVQGHTLAIYYYPEKQQMAVYKF